MAGQAYALGQGLGQAISAIQLMDKNSPREVSNKKLLGPLVPLRRRKMIFVLPPLQSNLFNPISSSISLICDISRAIFFTFDNFHRSSIRQSRFLSYSLISSFYNYTDRSKVSEISQTNLKQLKRHQGPIFLHEIFNFLGQKKTIFYQFPYTKEHSFPCNFPAICIGYRSTFFKEPNQRNLRSLRFENRA